ARSSRGRRAYAGAATCGSLLRLAPMRPSAPASFTETSPNNAPTTSDTKTLIATHCHDIDSRPPNAPVPAASGLFVIAAVIASTVGGPLPPGAKVSRPVAIHQKKTDAEQQNAGAGAKRSSSTTVRSTTSGAAVTPSVKP